MAKTADYGLGEIAIINNPNESVEDEVIVLRDADGTPLRLRFFRQLPQNFNFLMMFCREIPGSGGAEKISIYCPYLIINLTGLDLSYKARSLIRQNRYAAGQSSSIVMSI